MINWLKGVFLHKNNNEHFAIPRYSGITVIGYMCAKCGYKWYENRYK